MAPRLTPAVRHIRSLSERQVQEQYRRACMAVGCFVYHGYDSRFTDAGSRGYPDQHIIHVATGASWFVEWKREEGVVSPDQIEWHDALRRGGHLVEVHRPSTWSAAIRLLEEQTGQTVPTPWDQLPALKPKKKKRPARPAAA